MRHFDFRTLGMLALRLATPAALLTACDSEQSFVRAPVELGSLGFKLSVPSDLDFNKVAYTIRNKDGEIEKANEVVLAGGGSTFIAKIEGVPAGLGHTITMDAHGGAQPCSGEATFDVTAKQTTSVSIRLRCAGSSDSERGSVMLSGDFNVCPAVENAIATPNGNGTYALSADGSDLDGAPAALSYKWTANAGSIAAATAADATYTCPSGGGNVTVVLELSDGDDGCSEVDGVSETLTTIACDGSASTPVDSGQGAAGRASQAAAAGAPDRAPVKEWSAECSACRDQHCRDYAGSGTDLVDGCFNTSSDPTEPNFIQYCVDFLNCAAENECAYDANGAYACYCGSASLDDCMTNGPAADAKCMSETHRAAGSSAHHHIMLRFNDLAFPLGWAYFLLDCDTVSCEACTPL